jgi:hypothetical protein
MRALHRRLDVLENAGPPSLSPAEKQWLGWPLTEAERAGLVSEEHEPADWANVDTAGWSKEAKAWLGAE